MATSGQPAPREVQRASIALGVAVGVFGISFGVVATGGGLSVPMACAMSLLVFTGATQLAVIGVLAAGGSALAAIGSGLLLGARHIADGHGHGAGRPRPRRERVLVDRPVGVRVLKAAGLLALANRHLPARVEELLGLLPAALFGSLIVVSTFGDGQSLVIDARAAGLVAAAVAVWRRAGFVVVVLAAAVATGAVRAIA